MHVRRLSLAHFRNYERLDLDLSPNTTIIYGDNAQGKSNLLEAIFYLATTRSFRAGSDRELLSWGHADDPIGFTRIAARVERAAETFDLEIVLREEPRSAEAESNVPLFTKRIKLNDVPRRAIDVIGAATAVMFSPQDLELVEGAPLLRRRYLDVTISQADRVYCRSLAQYNRVVLQRNHLLRTIRDRGAPPDQLHFWNRELITAGAFIVGQRLATIRRLGDGASRLYAELGGDEDVLGISYKSSILRGEADPASSVEAIARAFEGRLAEVQPREIQLGMSLVGPHRDDLTFQLAGHDLGAFGSRGQQRTVALALKLAEADDLYRQTESQPIVLLDDVLSELDPSRRERVLASIQPGQQVLLTAADARSFDGALPKDAIRLRVARGRIEQYPSTSPK
ncbi:MAG TPA: DNA replication/repair protein RecF [Chloroflexota bacterium]|nr:DNA replication/repair protein RecF [Chloroflexota bacterium]